MDKRYLIIILILIFGSFNLYFIAIHSDTIGTASVNFGNYTISLPEGFDLYENRGGNSVILYNSKTDVYIAVYSVDSYNYTKDLNTYQNDSKTTVFSTGDIMVDDILVNSIFYNLIDEKNNRTVNFSKFYFTKDNHPFSITISKLNNLDDKNSIVEMIVGIVTSLRVNYKQT